MTANGRTAGDTVALPAGGGTVALTGRVESITPLERVFVVCRGEERADIPLSADRRSVAFEIDLQTSTAAAGATCAPKATRSERAPLDARYAQAFTNPIWITAGEQPVRDAVVCRVRHALDRPAARDGGGMARLAVRP